MPPRTFATKVEVSVSPSAHSFRSELATVAALVVVTAVWGSSFVVIHGLVNRIPPLDFLGVRFAIAGAIAAVVWWRDLRAAHQLTWHRGVTLGLVFALAQIAQTYGLAYTSASIAGFISGMYVVLTPLILVVFAKVRITLVTWLAFAIATLGMSLLTISFDADNTALAFGWGEVLTLLSAFLYALHIVLLGRWSSAGTQAQLTVIQMVTLGVVLGVCALPGGVVLPVGVSEWSQTLYMAVFASIFAIGIQTWAQSRISPTKTAIILTGEPVWGAFFAVSVGGEHVTTAMIVGGTLIVGAMLMTEVLPLVSAKRTKQGKDPL